MGNGKTYTEVLVDVYERIDVVEQRIVKRLDDMRRDIRDLQLSKATLEGKADQKSVYVAYLISAVGIVLGAVSLLIKFA